MKIIDRYLLGQFLQVFVICFCSVTGLVIVFDAFTNLDEFLRAAASEGSVLELMARFYGFQAIGFFDRTSGVLTLIAAMFTLTWIQRHQEMTALMAGGVSPGRVAKPVIAAGVIISLLAAASRELVIPTIRDELSRSSKDVAGDTARELTPRYDNETNVLLRGKQTFAKEQRIHRPSFVLPVELHDWSQQVSGETAVYQEPRDDRPGGYLFRKVDVPARVAEKETLVSFDTNRPLVLTAKDAPWLKADECFVVSSLSFTQLTRGSEWRRFSSTSELIAGLHSASLDFDADVRVAVHSRIVQPLLDITLLFLGLPLVLSRSQRNVFMAIGQCMALVAVFMLVVLAAQQLGNSYLLSPALAAWLPLIVFVPVAVGLSDPLRV